MARRLPENPVTIAVVAALTAMAALTAEGQSELHTPGIAEPQPKLIAEQGAGALYEVGEHLVCVMEGSPREMGYQHGRLLAEQVHHNLKVGYMQRSLAGRGYTRAYINEQAQRMAKHFPESYLEEIEGLVEGVKAGGYGDVTYEEILGAACVAELLHHGPDAPPGCTNFAVFGRWTPDGRLLHGRNLDWDTQSGAQETAAILVWRPENGIPFAMPGWAGCIGSVSGLNAKGVTIGEMTSSSPDETFDGIPLLIIMRRVLQEAGTLDEAVEIIRKGPRTLGWNFVLGDGNVPGESGNPDARALEVDEADCDVFVPADPGENESLGHRSLPDVVRRTNHPCGEGQMKKIGMAYARRSGLDIPDWETGKPIALALLKQENTYHRYVWLSEQIEAMPKGIGVEEALQLLANGPVLCDNTLHSWVFDPAKTAMYVSIAGWNPPVTATKRTYTRINLSKWFE